jgi:hypothetical protein
VITLPYRIARETGLDIEFISLIIRKAPHSYRHYQVPKKTHGFRDIYHPSAELKVLQTWVSQHVVSKLPVHDAAFAYRRGRNIKQHAMRHNGNSFLLKLDFQDFFPSIKDVDVERLLTESLDLFEGDLTVDDVRVVSRLTCREEKRRRGKRSLALTIGAPSSPGLSNAIMFHFDCAVADYCLRIGVTYTRYSDDLYFSCSAPNVLTDVRKYIQRLLSATVSPSLKLNNDKTVFTSRKRRRVVTGITLTSDRRISLGRDNKRYLRSSVHSYLSGALRPDEITRLRGRLAFAASVEPRFIASLEAKFGAGSMSEVLRGLKDVPTDAA